MLISRVGCLSPSLSDLQMLIPLPLDQPSYLVKHCLAEGLEAGGCWLRTRLGFSPSPKRPFPGTGCAVWPEGLMCFDATYWQKSVGRCARWGLAGLGDASVQHSDVPGKCWREVLMDRALLWASSSPKARPLHFRCCFLWKNTWLQTSHFNESDFTCQMTRFFVISPVKCEQLVSKMNGLRSFELLSSEKTGSPQFHSWN